MMILLKSLSNQVQYLDYYGLIRESGYSKSHIYKLQKRGVLERKVRDRKRVPENVVKSAVEVIEKYPHFSAAKGQSYMIYHQKGYIAQHVYKQIKKMVKRSIFHVVSSRNIFPARIPYEHERPKGPGEIWAEDFTQIRVCGMKYYIGLVIDVAMAYYLGVEVSLRPNEAMIEAPIIQALELNKGKGPQRFMLSDNGEPYVSNAHGEFLDKLDIVQKRIPCCKPEYNGSVECGIKEFKNVFYNVWAQQELIKGAVKKDLLDQLRLVIRETMRKMNDEIPRPCLKGVTPADVLKGIAKERIEINCKYVEQEQNKEEVIKPWNRYDWELIKNSLTVKRMSNLELMTKFCFFLKRPLRWLSNLMPEVLGN
jgi:transposase InsO family protein